MSRLVQLDITLTKEWSLEAVRFAARFKVMFQQLSVVKSKE